MTLLACVSQIASLALMWRIYRTPAEDGETNREGTEASDS